MEDDVRALGAWCGRFLAVGFVVFVWAWWIDDGVRVRWVANALSRNIDVHDWSIDVRSPLWSLDKLLVSTGAISPPLCSISMILLVEAAELPPGTRGY